MNILILAWNWVTGKTRRRVWQEAMVAVVEREAGRRAQAEAALVAVQGQLAKTDAALMRESARADAAERVKGPRVVKVPERAMPEADLKAELAVDDENMLWRAVHQLLDRTIGDAVDGVAQNQGERRIEHAGGIAALRSFQEMLLDYQAAGKKAEKEEAAAEP